MIEPGWYWVKHKHWTAQKGCWMMARVFERKPGQWRGREVRVYLNGGTCEDVCETQIEEFKPIDRPVDEPVPEPKPPKGSVHALVAALAIAESGIARRA